MIVVYTGILAAQAVPIATPEGTDMRLKRMAAAVASGSAAFLIFICIEGALIGEEPDPALAGAQGELFAARYENATALFSQIVEQRPATGDAWYGLVRAHLGQHHWREAYSAADQALNRAPQTAGAETAAGLAMYRRGDLGSAETHYQAALKIDRAYPGALRGLASIYSAISLFKSARDLRLKAYSAAPNDPDLMLFHANTLKGQKHIEALEEALARLDPGSEEARSLKVHIANDRAVGDRKLRRLISPYQNGRVKLLQLLDGPSRAFGVGIVARLNQKETVKLLMDTGASGISLSPKAAEKAGLQQLSSETSEAKGIGDQKVQPSIAYLASEVQAGDATFADYPISVFRSAKSADYDGLIGPDVFSPFLVKIDFVRLVMSLETRPAGSPEPPDEPLDWNGQLPPGFYRVLRFGDHLAVPTFINGGRSALFLVDSGSSANLIDTATAKEFTKVGTDSRTIVGGIQGKVDKVSRADRVSLVFAGFRQDNADVIAISLEKMSDSFGVGFGGILGMPVLRNLALTVDYRGGAIKFEYNKP